MSKEIYMKTLFKALNLLLKPKILKFFISNYDNGYLNEIGFFESYIKKASINKDGEPIPWVTYSYIFFIQERLSDKMNILEFGSGYSTLYYSRQVKTVYSIEHDKKWFENFKIDFPQNVKFFLKKFDFELIELIEKEIHVKFDIILVDGIERNYYLMNSLSFLKKSGVIILDDSEREDYCEGVNYLINKGFKKIDFWGISPGYFSNKCTSIFYRKINCLKI